MGEGKDGASLFGGSKNIKIMPMYGDLDKYAEEQKSPTVTELIKINKALLKQIELQEDTKAIASDHKKETSKVITGNQTVYAEILANQS
jgi:hypothetical protein